MYRWLHIWPKVLVRNSLLMRPKSNSGNLYQVGSLKSKIKKLGKLRNEDHKLKSKVFSLYEKRAIPTRNTDYISYGKRYDALSMLATDDYF